MIETVQEISSDNILKGLREKDIDIIDQLYDNFYPPIMFFISRNKGSEQDAQDIYQDALLIIYQKIVNNDLALTCSFNTFLFSVCRLLWLKKLEHMKQQNNISEETGAFIELDSSTIEILERNDRYKLYQEHFQKLSFSCRKVLELFLAGIPMREIAGILGFKSEQYAKKRKHQCKEKLVNSIKGDPEFKYLNNQVEIKIN